MNSDNVILSLSNYTIYDNVNYYLCIPKNESTFYHIFMGFSDKDLVNLSQEELIMEIRKIGDSINSVYNNAIYVLPVISSKLFKEATNENDDRLYNKILNNIIQPITFEIYKNFTVQNIGVSQIIKMIKQNDMDKKMVGWFSMKLGNEYIKEIVFEDRIEDQNGISEIEVENITHNNNSIFVDCGNANQFVEDNEIYISDSLKPAVSPGFSSWGLILMVLFIALIFGGAIAYMIIK